MTLTYAAAALPSVIGGPGFPFVAPLSGRRFISAWRSARGRTFSWFGCNRRLAKDFENLAETLATFAILASIQLAFRWLARP